MFNGLPNNFEDKKQAADLYVQKKIYEALKFLTILPVNQNETGLFTNYIQGAVEVADPEFLNDGIDFNEISFGKGSTVGGQTTAHGYMYRANTRNDAKGQYMSQLTNFYNKAVIKIADYYEDKYSKALFAGARKSTATLAGWDTAENIIDNEVILDDEMRYDAQDNPTGYAPNTVLCNRRDRLVIEQALRKEDYRESNFNYIASNKIPQGDFIVFDAQNPGAVIEKFVDPQYNVIQSMENDGLTITENGTMIPPAFLNLSEVQTDRPQVVEYYLWNESALNFQDSNGFLVIE